MNELIPHTRVEGNVTLDGEDIYGEDTDVVSLRQRIGMVFQRPNPFPKSIFENVAFGPRVLGSPARRRTLKSAWKKSEVRGFGRKCPTNSTGMPWGSPRQQQRSALHGSCRQPRLSPDEPCSALILWPRSNEELMKELKQTYTIVIVTTTCSRQPALD
jgi:phosphate transport system ATP-binding protein